MFKQSVEFPLNKRHATIFRPMTPVLRSDDEETGGEGCPCSNYQENGTIGRTMLR